MAKSTRTTATAPKAQPTAAPKTESQPAQVTPEVSANPFPANADTPAVSGESLPQSSESDNANLVNELASASPGVAEGPADVKEHPANAENAPVANAVNEPSQEEKMAKLKELIDQGAMPSEKEVKDLQKESSNADLAAAADKVLGPSISSAHGFTEGADVPETDKQEEAAEVAPTPLTSEALEGLNRVLWGLSGQSKVDFIGQVQNLLREHKSRM